MLKLILKYLLLFLNLTLAFDSDEDCNYIVNGKNALQEKWNPLENFLNLSEKFELSKESDMNQQRNASFGESCWTQHEVCVRVFKFAAWIKENANCLAESNLNPHTINMFLINLNQFAQNNIYAQLKMKTHFLCFKMLNRQASKFDSINFTKMANFVNWVEENANELNVNNNPTICGEYLLPIVLYFSVFVTFII